MIIYAFLYRFAIGQSPKLLVSPGSGFSPAELFLPWGEFFKGVFFFFFKGFLLAFFCQRSFTRSRGAFITLLASWHCRLDLSRCSLGHRSRSSERASTRRPAAAFFGSGAE
mgnify:CR=1 FL=1